MRAFPDYVLGRSGLAAAAAAAGGGGGVVPATR